jgi:accessory gene regulator B
MVNNMDISEYISKILINFIKSSLYKTDTELEQIKYGLDSILTNVTKLIILFIAAYFLGIVKYTFVALISFGFLRGFASGIHANSSLKCILTNFIIFFGNVYLSYSLNLNKLHISILFLIGLYLVILYAPADTASKPLTRRRVRTKLKICASITVIILYFLSINLNNNIYANLITFSVLFEALLITPMAYKIFKSTYKNYERFQ